ncbi:MAG: nuclear transport factor 2 family protein [Candidatus Heimdallarchaeota archaeon]|nr:nuclear transport factor 2 family protein [Candidatus Heimdallarchaeota archaeon]
MVQKGILEKIRLDINQELYDEIRDLWKVHSIAEDNRDIPGLMSTLTDDCVYEIPQKNAKWVGLEGATNFYLELLGAFPDINFDLQNIVIGPQGVFEEAIVTGTHKGRWLDNEPTGEKVEFNVTILFPWDHEKRKFSGERIYTDYF